MESITCFQNNKITSSWNECKLCLLEAKPGYSNFTCKYLKEKPAIDVLKMGFSFRIILISMTYGNSGDHEGKQKYKDSMPKHYLKLFHYHKHYE